MLKTISLCLTNYNRFDLLMQSFAAVIDDPRVSEIIIVDDHSDPEIYNQVQDAVSGIAKIQLYRNPQNLGMSLNKKRSIEYASNEWCIVFDSDNVMGPDYIDSAFRYSLEEEVIYCPSFAKPNFDYRAFISLEVSKKNIKPYLKKRMFDCLMNTCNYMVNRKKYLEVYKHNPEMKGTDTIWFNYLWLKAGYSFYVVPGLQYEHRVHDGSGFMADVSYNMKKAEQVKNMIKAL